MLKEIIHFVLLPYRTKKLLKINLSILAGKHFSDISCYEGLQLGIKKKNIHDVVEKMICEGNQLKLDLYESRVFWSNLLWVAKSNKMASHILELEKNITLNRPLD